MQKYILYYKKEVNSIQYDEILADPTFTIIAATITQTNAKKSKKNMRRRRKRRGRGEGARQGRRKNLNCEVGETPPFFHSLASRTRANKHGAWRAP